VALVAVSVVELHRCAPNPDLAARNFLRLSDFLTFSGTPDDGTPLAYMNRMSSWKESPRRWPARSMTVAGKRVVLSYQQHKFVPSSCFGETEYFVTAVREVSDQPLAPSAAPQGQLQVPR
jgi:hypothetical protein